MLRKFLFISIFCAVMFSLSSCSTYNAATGRNEFIFISTAEEVAMGDSVHKQLQQQYDFSTDSKKIQRLREIGNRVAQVSDRQDYPYQFFLVDKDEINAFTTPGGRIYFFTGLFDRMQSDDQLAFVLAHEIGHCAAKHVVKKYQAALGYSLIGSIALGQVEAGAAQRVLALSSNTLMKLVSSAYGRGDELEADRLGVKYMYLAGYRSQAGIETLQILQDANKGPRPPEILMTHPYEEDRILAIKNEIPKVEARYGRFE